MAGLFGLFGGNKNQEPSQSQDSAFFLDADSAKTLGDIDYMRSSKVVKRTFPKTAGNKGEFEQVESISAMGKVKLDEMAVNGSAAPSTPATPSTPNVNEATSQRRKTDTSMDMFRNMAKDIKKR